MDRKFIGDRITSLRIGRDISERALSNTIGKSDNYINSITTGRTFPSIESLLSICDYFEITIFDFFYPSVQNPELLKKAYDEIIRISADNLEEFILILQSMKPSDFEGLVSFMNRYKWNKNQSLIESKTKPF